MKSDKMESLIWPLQLKLGQNPIVQVSLVNALVCSKEIRQGVAFTNKTNGSFKAGLPFLRCNSKCCNFYHSSNSYPSCL